MTKSLKIAGLALASLTVTLATPVLARQGADDPAGHVRQEDRRADRTTEVRQADRSTESRSANDVRREDRAAEARHGADDPAGHR